MKRFWFPLCLFTMLLFGGFDMLKGVAAPFMQTAWRMDYGELGTVFAIGSFGYLVATFVTGFVIESLGVRFVVVAGALTLVVGTTGVILSPSYLPACVSFFVNGMGGGVLEIGVNAVVPAMAKSASGQSRYFNWLHGFYGIGACGFPLLIAWLLRLEVGWRWIYGLLLLAVGLLAAAAAVAKQPVSLASPTEQPIASSHVGLWREKALYGLLVAIMAYVMAEVGLGTWLTTYLVKARGVPLSLASVCLSGFFLTFTIGRLAAPLLLRRIGHHQAILAGLVLSLFSLGLAWLPGNWSLLGFWLAGLGYSIIFPTITAVASHTFAAYAGKVLGLLFTAAGIGSLVTNALIGGVATVWGVAAGFSLLWVYLIIVVCSMLFVIATTKSQRAAGCASAQSAPGAQ
ncbi:MAG: MFS transporter [Alicyclobacillus herbarius]|uniref:MFS transporter n=1 Tax=Alicyclobacillus herbarius TaxID=122960 RepID=UPI0023562834|nr:MFS transporter [Alicyclobacillus herbarius]MCL6633441.1 MFS transporter [Alicyclobacillus herbarius]